MSKLKYYIPYACFESIFDIDVDYYKKNNIKYIFSDLDNTLDPYYNKVASTRTIEYINKITASNITFIVISNNSKKRVTLYINSIKNDKIKWISRAWKPRTRKIDAFIKENNIDKSQSIFIGDQLITDIKVANKLNIRCILTKELVNKNQLISKFNKYRAKLIYKKLDKKGLLKGWRELDGKANKNP